jgi:S1-C subfamily serine protease
VVLESDNLTFRPTVLIRRGTSQGSGTIIASLDGETLVLTASHVIRGVGPIHVELHRYNLGIERASTADGKWPRQVPAEAVAADPAADMAILRVRNMVALPYVARLGSSDDQPETNEDLTSVGIDLGSKLSSWRTRLVETLWFELNDSGGDRPFLVTAKIPEHGRSGGGLFDKDGRLVGVCIGHAELVKGRRMGVFSSIESARQLLREHELTSVIDRSEARRARLTRNFALPGRRITRRPNSDITSTGARRDGARPQP